MKIKHLFIFCALMIMQAAQTAESNSQKPLLTILYTGETHAALLPCDCPLQSVGGVARRATVIKRYRERGPTLLLDAGAWAAGGIYDEDSDGDLSRDELRSNLMRKAMKLMKYDFFVPGAIEAKLIDSETGCPARALGFRAIEAPSDALGAPLYLIGWSEPGAMIFGNAAPEPSAVWQKSNRAGFELHISRLGEEGSEALARFTGANLIINAGRKISQRLAWKVGETTLVNFDYQAQRLGVIEIYSLPTNVAKTVYPRFDIRARLETLTPDIPDDPEVAALLAPHLEILKKRGKKRISMEFWTMPECPGSIQALPMLRQLASDLGARVDISTHFVVHKEDGKFASLHGDGELNEARLQASIQKHYPDKIWTWLNWRLEQRNAPWETGAVKFGLMPARLRGALASGEADMLLEADYELMQRRRVEGTPLLIIGNRSYDGPLDRQQILRVLCAALDAPKPEVCKDIPLCFFDAQCRQRGFIGKCLEPGKPAARCDTSRPALKIPAVIITDRENLLDNHEQILEALIGDLPGIDYRVLDIADAEGRALLDKGKILRLPAYILDAIAQNEVGYADSIGKAAALNEQLGKLTLNPYFVGAHRLSARARIKGSADLFLSRFSKNGQEALETAIEYLRATGTQATNIIFHDALFWKESSTNPRQRELAALGGLAELEEAARALAVKKIAAEKYLDYLLERGKRRGGSYWDAPLKTLGIDAAQARELAEEPSNEILKIMQSEADLLNELNAGGEIVLLAENCEIIPVRSRQDLRQILERIALRRSTQKE